MRLAQCNIPKLSLTVCVTSKPATNDKRPTAKKITKATTIGSRSKLLKFNIIFGIKIIPKNKRIKSSNLMAK